ncbi:hypothetical protein NQ318_012614 [Aromia moschata]|uniref:Protein THEM6 n=1 Tax=Aromia moschata TaxID=1265417 RepID=A0AAV8YIY9_9CUCU|nr:hypothetical protein NQ318_012614 [Aromia moschata]
MSTIFFRIIFTIGLGKLFDKKKKIDEETEIYDTINCNYTKYMIRLLIFTTLMSHVHYNKVEGICTSQDLDIFFKHMNNARYVRDLDFARFHFYERTGLYDEITKAKGHVLQTASNIRYRRTIPLFNTYKVTTKIVYWEEKTMYIEQQFITLSDGFIRAIVLSQARHNWTQCARNYGETNRKRRLLQAHAAGRASGLVNLHGKIQCKIEEERLKMLA